MAAVKKGEGKPAVENTLKRALAKIPGSRNTREEVFSLAVRIVRGDFEAGSLNLKQQLEVFLQARGKWAPACAFFILVWLETPAYEAEKAGIKEELFPRLPEETFPWLLEKLSNVTMSPYFFELWEKTPKSELTPELKAVCMHYAGCRQNLELLKFLHEEQDVPLPPEIFHLFCYTKTIAESQTRALITYCLSQGATLDYVYTLPYKHYVEGGVQETFTLLQFAVVSNCKEMYNLYKEYGANPFFSPMGTTSCAELIRYHFYSEMKL